jgi:Flp pilus assembly protein TadD
MRHPRTNLLVSAVLIATSHSATPQDNPTPANTAAVSKIVGDAYAALQRKDYEASREASLKVLALDSRNQYALSYLGHACQMLGEFPRAEEAYRNLIAINPRHNSAYDNLGLVYFKQGRTDEAIANYRKQLEVTPRNGYAFSKLSRALALQGKWEEALEPAAMAAELASPEAVAWQFLGKVQIKTGRIDEARRTFGRALALPHEPILENNVAYDLADAGVDLDRSWELISGALRKTEPLLCEPAALSDGDKCTTQLRQISTMLDTAGWVLYRLGRIEEAEPYLRSSFAVTPRGVNELHMVALFAKLKRLDEAAKLFSEVRTRPNFEFADSSETLRELTNAAGGEAKLDALLDRAAPVAPKGVAQARVIALVDGSGKITGVGTPDPALPGVAEAAKSMTLPALSWLGHSFRSIRSIEFVNAGGRWTPVESYVGTTLPPPPCGIVAKPVQITREMGSPAASSGCPAAF